MGFGISTNLAAMSINRNLSQATEEQAKHYQRLSSGLRITQSGDDAAGLSISEHLRAQIRSMDQAQRNANDGISFTQVAEGGLTEISNIMVRLRELGIQAASDTIGDRERGFIQQEVASLTSEVDRIANGTNFNGTFLLNGQAPNGPLQIQVGIHATETDRIEFNPELIDSTTTALGIENLSFETIEGARDSLDKLDEGMARVFSNRASLGAMQTKLQATSRNLDVTKENLAIARSRIADTDIAQETSQLVRGNILQAAGVAVLAQANNSANQVLKLLQS